jgi:DNA-directed RNA polymerase subunit RPC12/RpoP
VKTEYNRYKPTRDLLVRGIAAAKAGDLQEAYRYLERYLYQGPDEKESIDAMYYLGLVSPTKEEQRTWLEKILMLNPVEGRARRQLAILDGKLHPNQIIDPDRLKPQQPATVQSSGTDRFTCPQCGGRMTFTPDGQSLTCEFCEVKSFREHDPHDGVYDENFMLALATAKGHSQAVNTQVLHCGGCGAEFLVPPRQLSWVCPYCASNHSVQQTESRPLIHPNSLIPFAGAAEEARKQVLNWMEEKIEPGFGRLESLQGIYLPMWTFDVGGYVKWGVEVMEKQVWLTQQGSRLIYYDDLCIPATSKLSELLPKLFAGYDYKKLVPFDPRYLANWLAETYTIPVGDAALRAREKALHLEKEYFNTVYMLPTRDLRIDTSLMSVEQYKLVLLPVWVVVLVLGEEPCTVLINGQNGKLVFDTKITRNSGNWLSRLLDWND